MTFEDRKENTIKLLDLCMSIGFTHVLIGGPMKNNGTYFSDQRKVPCEDSEEAKKIFDSYYHTLFGIIVKPPVGYEENRKKYEMYPIIWNFIKDRGEYPGCGNGYQIQVNNTKELFIEGLYDINSKESASIIVNRKFIIQELKQ